MTGNDNLVSSCVTGNENLVSKQFNGSFAQPSLVLFQLLKVLLPLLKGF